MLNCMAWKWSYLRPVSDKSHSKMIAAKLMDHGEQIDNKFDFSGHISLSFSALELNILWISTDWISQRKKLLEDYNLRVWSLLHSWNVTHGYSSSWGQIHSGCPSDWHNKLFGLFWLSADESIWNQLSETDRVTRPVLIKTSATRTLDNWQSTSQMKDEKIKDIWALFFKLDGK